MQQLLIIQSLWGMERLKGQTSDLPAAAAIAKVAAAGFDGVTHHFTDETEVKTLAALRAAHGLTAEAQCFPTAIDELKPTLELAHRYGAHHITIQADVRPRAFAQSARIVEGWCRLAESSDIPVYLETHRGRLNNDMLLMLDLLEALPDLRLLADLSHYVVAREFPAPPVPGEMEAQVQALLARAWAAHGRIAAPGQVQVELTFPQHQPWVAQFSAWWTSLMRGWKARAGAADSFAFTCELGPQPYAISGPTGEDLTDRWADALALRDIARHCWAAA
ncbi:sugar phosphate isomerase/epimerase [Acidocella sp.]|uniref:sugar phosphate isomerase/epimerase family protein n=1 Tax=Acidocella sp. TaxID=50710 RepID=UPI002638BCA9|nr:TIM barrel protein [Acidocella sp.]